MPTHAFDAASDRVLTPHDQAQSRVKAAHAMVRQKKREGELHR
jgi:hypothetical protein